MSGGRLARSRYIVFGLGYFFVVFVLESSCLFCRAFCFCLSDLFCCRGNRHVRRASPKS